MAVPNNTYIVTIDSSDRNRDIWSKSSEFEVQFDPAQGYTGAGVQKSFRNIISIELVDFIHPYIEGCSHLYLRIRELDGKILSTYNGLTYFAKIIPKAVIGGFVYSYTNEIDTNGVFFPVRGTRIDKMTFEIIKPNGELVNFGPDTPNTSDPNPAVQVSMTFKIVVEGIQRY